MSCGRSLDQLIRPLQERLGDGQAEGLGALEVDQVSCERGRLTRRLLEPELHVHLAVHRRCGREMLLRLLPSARAPVELAEAEVVGGGAWLPERIVTEVP
jgi:hypothetical protein